MLTGTQHHDRGKHETRRPGEVRPLTVEAAIREAHKILSGVGVVVAPAKVAKLARSYVTAAPPCSLASFLSRAVVPVASSPLPRRRPVWQLDPTYDTAEGRNPSWTAERVGGGHVASA